MKKLRRQRVDFGQISRFMASAGRKLAAGKGRVFYTALGHRPEVWADERLRTYLLNGLRWVMKDAK